MSLSLLQTLTAVGPNITSAFNVSGGTAPYTYQVQPGGAGGTIVQSSTSAVYTAPSFVPNNAAQQYDTIVVTDSSSPALQTSGKILVGDPVLLVCDILQTYMGLPNGRVYLWDQKIMQPTDTGIYIAVSVLSCKAFGNDRSYTGTSNSFTGQQSVNMAATLQIDIISRDNSARLQKESVLLALNSDYAEQQMNANNFFIGKLPPGAQFNNLSMQDGAAIPYRFTISIVIQYLYQLFPTPNYMTPTNPPTVNYVQK